VDDASGAGMRSSKVIRAGQWLLFLGCVVFAVSTFMRPRALKSRWNMLVHHVLREGHRRVIGHESARRLQEGDVLRRAEQVALSLVAAQPP
jgi:hypothetical protein